jgi:integrase
LIREDISPHFLGYALQAAELKAASKAPNTWKSYGPAFQKFEDWCENMGVPSLPASSETVEFYMADLAFTKESVPLVQMASAAIGAFHRFEGFESPTDDPSVRVVIQGIRRTFGKEAKQGHPITQVEKRNLLRFYLTESVDKGNIMSWRTAWLESMLYHAAARWSDLSELKREHFTFVPGGMIVFFPKRKNDQFRAGHYVRIAASRTVFCPVRLSRMYFGLLGRKYTGFVLPRMLKKAKNEYTVFEKTPATYQSCRAEQIEGLKGVGLDHTIFGLHSGRICSTVLLRRAKFSMSAIGRRVGWAPGSKTVIRYAKMATEEFDLMNKALEL